MLYIPIHNQSLTYQALYMHIKQCLLQNGHSSLADQFMQVVRADTWTTIIRNEL